MNSSPLTREAVNIRYSPCYSPLKLGCVTCTKQMHKHTQESESNGESRSCTELKQRLSISVLWVLVSGHCVQFPETAVSLASDVQCTWHLWCMYPVAPAVTLQPEGLCGQILVILSDISRSISGYPTSTRSLAIQYPFNKLLFLFQLVSIGFSCLVLKPQLKFW